MSQSPPRAYVPTTLGLDDVELLGREKMCDSFFPHEEITLRRRAYDGEWSETFKRELLSIRHTVGLLPYDPAIDAVLLVEQFRPIPFMHGDAPWMAQCIAGILSDGEDAEDGARREAKEEAGLDLTHLVRITDMYLSPGAVMELHHLYAAQADLSAAGGFHGLDHEHEDIRALVVDADDAIRAKEDGRIRDAMTIVALMWLERERPKLQADWG